MSTVFLVLDEFWAGDGAAETVVVCATEEIAKRELENHAKNVWPGPPSERRAALDITEVELITE